MRRALLANVALIIALIVANGVGAFASDRVNGDGHASQGLHLNRVRVAASAHVSVRAKGPHERWTNGAACCQVVTTAAPVPSASSLLCLRPASAPRHLRVAPPSCRPPPFQL